MSEITLNMITGRFKEPFLKEAVNSVLPMIDDIIFVDTEPGNNPNVEDMESFNCTIFQLPRKSDKEFSYAEARNLALNNTKTEWCLKLDADEALHEKYHNYLRDPLDTTNVNAIDIKFWHHMIHPDYYLDVGDDWRRILFKREHTVWIGDVHEGNHTKGPILDWKHLVKQNHYGYCRDPNLILQVWQLYDSKGGLGIDLTERNSDNLLDDVIPHLQHYPETHPAAILPKLKEMFPDLGTYPLDKVT